MLSTGLRRSEALGMRWDDVALDERVLVVRRQLRREADGLVTVETKTAKRAAAASPWPPRLAPRCGPIGPARTPSAWRSVRRGSTAITSLRPRSARRSIPATLRGLPKVRADAGLGRWHPHKLRHSAASLMLAPGVKLQVVSEVLGRSSIRMTADVYGHVLASDRRAAADAMDTVLWGPTS